MERAFLETVQTLRSAGINVRILTLDGSGSDENVPIPTQSSGLRIALRPRILRKWLQQHTEPHEIIVLCGVWTAVPALYLGRLPRRTIVWEHSIAPNRWSTASAGLKTLIMIARYAYRNAEKVVTVSPAIAHHLVSSLSMPGAKVTVIPNPTPVGTLPLRKPRRHAPLRVLSVGALSPVKNAQLLFDALKLVDTPVSLRVAGDGPLRRSLEEIAKTLPPIHTVTFLGYVPQDALSDEYHQADILAHTSLSETFGYVLFDAAAHGVDVLALDYPIMDQLIDSTIIPGTKAKNDASSVASALAMLANSPTSVADQEVAFRNRMTFCGPSSIVERWTEVLGVSY
ncbi:glycosyltransferase [Timonella senegalensis]|uniref:glycosyltransferase n=1 Tax=Timonella senegalensis TaxID=1465825 RepID=UPI001E4000A4|nr:glycosyltransferase [Timonella senegalensis]